MSSYYISLINNSLINFVNTKMKKIIKNIVLKTLAAVAFAAFFTATLAGQALPGGVSPEEETKDVEDGAASQGMMCAGFKAANMLDEWGYELGLDLIARLNENFGVGGSMYYLLSHNLKAPSQNGLVNPHVKLFYFGLNLDYSFSIVKDLEVSAFALFTAGQTNLNERTDIDVSSSMSSDWIFMAEPSLNLRYFFNKNIGVGISAGYRASTGVNKYQLTNSDLSGTVLSLYLCTRM